MIQVRRLGFDDLQLLRYWRNKDHVREWMVDQRRIGYLEQQHWFNSLSDTSDHYFVYSFEHTDIGSVNLTHVDIPSGSFSAGIFCGNSEFLRHKANVCALIWLYSYAFEKLKLNEALATVNVRNTSARRLNLAIGFTPHEVSSKGFDLLKLTRSEFLTRKPKLLKLVGTTLPSFEV